jgi:plasmid stabilization system protein ParE
MWGELRRALLDSSVPYAVHFRDDKDSVTVLAVLHQRRNPNV